MNLYTECPKNSFAEESDEALCALVAGGDRLAEEVLIRRYHQLVRAITHHYYLVGGDSDDLIQEGMMGLMKAVREFDCSKEASFRTFAEVCIRNRMFSALRAATREKHSPLNQSISLETPFFDSNAYATVAISDSSADPEELFILREKKERDLVRIKEQLSPLERKVLERYLVGMTNSEIAEALGKPAKSIENAVQRIRKKAARL